MTTTTTTNLDRPKIPLLGKSVDQLTDLALSLGLRRFVGAQIADWIYKKQAVAIDQMTNISVTIREQLAEQYEVGGAAPISTVESKDGTKKYLFPTPTGAIEAVFIPDGERGTLCISSQRGCRMGCTFCMTGRMGFHQDLTSEQILGQILRIPEAARITNVVLMGMGEPLDNYDNVMSAITVMTAQWGFAWSPTRVTLSTVGLTPLVERFMRDTRVHLAVSLHNPFHEERVQSMPAENRYPIKELIQYLRTQDWGGQRRLSFEYIMLAGVNDTDRHLRGLMELLDALWCRVNLIRLHAGANDALQGSSERRISEFNYALNDAGIITTTRSSRGEDILAACGMLAASSALQSE